MAEAAESWKLESFIDSLVHELDKARDTLSLKGITRKLSYAVQDVSFDLHVFPQYDRGALRFRVARPGDEGASRIAFQLGSITDRQITETSTAPVSGDDLTLDEIEGIEPEVKQELKKVGVTSARDLERLEQRNVDLGAVVQDRTEGRAKVDYADLADKINAAKRGKAQPMVKSMTLEPGADGRLSLVLTGSHLAPDIAPEGYPRATLNGVTAELTEARPERVVIALGPEDLRAGSNPLSVALDPFAELRLDLKRGGPKT